MHAGLVSTGDGSANASGPDDPAGDAVERTLAHRAEALQRLIREAEAAHAQRIEGLQADHERWLKTVGEEQQLIHSQIAERVSSREASDVAATQDAAQVAEIRRQRVREYMDANPTVAEQLGIDDPKLL